MKTLGQKILDYSILHWQKNFTGISGIDIAQHFKIPHKKVLAILDEFEQQKKGSIRRDVKLYQLTISVNKPKFGSPKEINTSIFFPSKDILTESFYSNELPRQNIPEYKARLYKGGSQIQLLYFDHEVLDRYLKHREIYDVEDTVASGDIHLSHEYLSGLSEDELEKINFPLVRFGKRHLSNGTAVITVILHDLSELPEKEQAYWRAHEIEEPQFATNDKDFEIYFRRNFEAEFLDDNDPLQKVLEEVNKINALIGENGLFTINSNPYLSYPVVNTYKSFCDSCSELYKIFSPDSLSKEKLKHLLKKYFKYTEQDFVHKESGRLLGEHNLLKRLCEEIQQDDLYENIEKIKKYRVSADHKVTLPTIAEQNYITKFRQIAHELSTNLNSFAQRIEKLMPSEK
jgi:hypothetical protein